MHSYRTVISSNPSAHFSFCCPCFQVPSTTHWMIIFSKFPPPPLIYYHNQGILVRSVLCIGRQNAGCNVCSTPRFSRHRHFQVTADPLWPMIWDHTTSICHRQYGRVLREWPVIFFRVSLHLTLGLLFLRIPLKVPWMMIFFSKWSAALLQTWPKYFSLCWPILVDSDGYLPMRDCMCSLVMRSLYDIPSSFLQHHISKADFALLSAFPTAFDLHP